MYSYFKAVYQAYEEYFSKNADYRTRSWFLLWNNPIYVWIISVLYLLFVWLGPQLFKKQRPLQLRFLLIVYNFGQVLLSAYMTIELFLSTQAAGYNRLCDPYNKATIKNPAELRIAKVMWWYFFSKIIDLLDTVFMILRKKSEQVSVLHVFHHWSMVVVMWWIAVFTPGGQPTLGALLNSAIHVLMYSYYGLSMFPVLRKKLWWKKNLTQLQLVQFFILVFQTLYSALSDCDYPKWGAYLLLGQVTIYITLFAHFYLKSYTGKKLNMQDANGNTKTLLNGESGTYRKGL